MKKGKLENIVKVDKDADNKIKLQFETEVKQKILKSKKNCFVAIILRESKNASILYIPNRISRFSYEGNIYFNTAKGKYLNYRTVVSVYLEGCVLPIDNSYLQYEEQYILYYDDKNNPVTNIKDVDDITKILLDSDGNPITTENGFIVSDIKESIKGLEFDSKTADILFESNLADRMSDDKNAKLLPTLTILNMIILACVVTGIIVSYVYH